MTIHTIARPVVAREQWLAARKALLKQEKELARMRDQLSCERRELPRVRGDGKLSFRHAERPKGRDEDDLPYTMSWLRHHDRYDD
jgi:predicted dithiol-disulfide oxidoreductase (DUF899 family)